jgi:hypothetical protein
MCVEDEELRMAGSQNENDLNFKTLNHREHRGTQSNGGDASPFAFLCDPVARAVEVRNFI